MRDLDARGYLLREAGTAVHRPIATRPEWHRCLDAARGADRTKARPALQSAGAAVATLRSPRLAAVTAPLRLILKAFLGEEMLLSFSENKRVSTILTG
jgi:hypothetical protein